MSDNAQKTELLTHLCEQKIITEDQLSRAKLYLQFISNISFNTQDDAIDWLLENRIISERPVTEAPALVEEVIEQPSEPEIVAEEVIEQPSAPETVAEEVIEQPSESETVAEEVIEQPSESETVAEEVIEKPSEPETVAEEVIEQPSELETVVEEVIEQPSEPETVVEEVIEQPSAPETVAEEVIEQPSEPETVAEEAIEQRLEQEDDEENIDENPAEPKNTAEDIIEWPSEDVTWGLFEPDEFTPEEDTAKSTQSDNAALLTDEESDAYEMLLELYAAGVISSKVHRKAEKVLEANPDIRFENNDELLTWLEQQNVIKAQPVRPEPSKKRKRRDKPTENNQSIRQNEEPAATAPTGGGCIKKLIWMSIIVAAICWFFAPDETPLCDDEEIQQQVTQGFAATYSDTPAAARNQNENRLIAAPINYRFSSLTSAEQTSFNDDSLIRSCKATVIYRADRNRDIAADIIGEVTYQIQPTDDGEFSTRINNGKNEIAQKVKEQNARYYALNQQETGLKKAFITGVEQLDKILIERSPSFSPLTPRISGININDECQQVKDTHYTCPVTFHLSYGRNSRNYKASGIKIDMNMPVIKQEDGSWQPHDSFVVQFTRPYMLAIKNALINPPTVD
ncbi:hypothetical protein [Pragia fontium]|uniref:hypothetical protein n=1 Tax=Pragia fontium TaxID=82985 RepID=UPI00064B3ED9|nr:hypothetical protein [Pragia fontium]AKJ40690.1 hypothetical protein QQ39_00230 [Pragia fontium]